MGLVSLERRKLCKAFNYAEMRDAEGSVVAMPMEDVLHVFTRAFVR